MRSSVHLVSARRFRAAGLLAALAVVLSTLTPLVRADGPVRAAERPRIEASSLAERSVLARPRLTNPMTLNLHVGPDELRLRDGRDYVLVLPSVKKTGVLEIRGGRNIRVIGGYLSVAKTGPNIVIADGPNARDGRIVHLEGLLIDGSSGVQADGIRIKARRAIVQIVNSRIVGLRGSARGLHADVIQPFGGVKQLRIDGLTASSHYNNLFLRRENHPLGPRIGPVVIRRTNVFGYWNGRSAHPTETLRAISFGTQAIDPLDDRSAVNCRLTSRLVLRSFYVKPARKRAGQFVYPHDRMQHAGCPARVNTERHTIRWPALDRVDGVARIGRPPGGDFVPAALVGLNYSP